ncbi:MAG: AGE family epimerase/isomerase [Hyphomicrobium sp.]|nr:AGE family epimerase/isomerase [Hyphomicrobium sp.]
MTELAPSRPLGIRNLKCEGTSYTGIQPEAHLIGPDAIISKASKWLFERALPFWSDSGVDYKYGGFAEELRLDGTNPHVNFKRTRVQARQVYVYSHAAILGVPGAASVAEYGYRFITSKAWAGEDAGWLRQVTIDGRPLDNTPDLYDISFVLFSLGWYFRATGDRSAVKLAKQTLKFVSTHMRHPTGRGFLATRPADGPRLQNPHMHLFEAALSAYEAISDQQFLELADEVFALFENHFFDEATGTIPELFDERLVRKEDNTGFIVEPGHSFEWAWLLSWYQRLTGRDTRCHVRALVHFAEKYGVDHESGGVFDLLRSDGRVVDRSERVWPIAERLQAAVATFELFNKDPTPVFAQSCNRLLTKHLAYEPIGAWMDHFDESGKPKVGKIPASTLYHIMIAFSEMLRVKENAFETAQNQTIAIGGAQ